MARQLISYRHHLKILEHRESTQITLGTKQQCQLSSNHALSSQLIIVNIVNLNHCELIIISHQTESAPEPAAELSGSGGVETAEVVKGEAITFNPMAEEVA